MARHRPAARPILRALPPGDARGELAPVAPTPRRPRRRRRSGQSLVEFALILPVTLLVILAGLDFGRVFLGWVDLHSMARAAANFAAENPEAWDVHHPDLAAQAEYLREMQAEASGINCTLPATLPAPSFPNGPSATNNIGTPVRVTVSCAFDLLTPVISAILPNPLPVSASAAFPIRNGAILNMPTPTPVATWWWWYWHPSPTPSPTATPAVTPSPTPTPSPTAVGATPTPSPTPSPSPTPAECEVPNLVGLNIRLADDYWGLRGHGDTDGAGFLTTPVFDPLVGNSDNGTVTGQSIIAGATRPCLSTAITLTWSP